MADKPMLDRRDFLQGAFSALGLAALSPQKLAWAMPEQGEAYLVTAHTTHARTVGDHTAVDCPGSVRFFNMGSGRVFEIPTPIFAHVFEQSPVQPNSLIGAGKWTRSAVVIDVRGKRVAQQITAPSDYRFSGHACFSQDGHSVYLSAHSEKTRSGALLIYDCHDWRLKKTVFTNGNYAHECMRMSDHTLGVVNAIATEDPLLSTIQLINEKDFSAGPIYQTPKATHLQILDQNRLLVGGVAPMLSIFTLNLDTRAITKFGHPEIVHEDHQNEALNLVALSKNLFAITVWNQNTLVLWDTASGQASKTVYGGNAFGLFRDQDKVYLNSGEKGFLHVFSTAQAVGQPVKSIGAPIEFANGRHLRKMYL